MPSAVSMPADDPNSGFQVTEREYAVIKVIRQLRGESDDALDLFIDSDERRAGGTFTIYGRCDIPSPRGRRTIPEAGFGTEYFREF